jgi:hypothetical protein
MRDRAQDPPPGEWLTPGIAADYIGVTTKHLRKLCTDHGVITWRTAGGDRRYRLDSLQALKEKRDHESQRDRFSAAQLREAKRRYCPACERGNALSFTETDAGTARYCRYCDYVGVLVAA